VPDARHVAAHGAQKINVGKGGKEEEPFNDGGETYQVQEKLLPMFHCPAARSIPDGVHPFVQNWAFLVMDEIFFHRGKRRRAVGGIGNVVVEQRQIKLHMHGFLRRAGGRDRAGLSGELMCR